jgi:hypothetical protein
MARFAPAARLDAVVFAINALARQMGVSAVSFRNLVIVISVVTACAGAVVHAHAAIARPPEMKIVAEAYAAALEAIPTIRTPLLDPSALPADRACEAKEPRTFAILIGAVDSMRISAISPGRPTTSACSPRCWRGAAGRRQKSSN